MSRLPIRVRVTIAFAAIMALVLAAVGLFLYLRLESQLNESIDQGLRSRAVDVTGFVQRSDAGLRGASDRSLLEQDESFAQILDARGRVVDSTPQLRGLPVLRPAQLAGVDEGATFVDRTGLPGIDGTARLLATRLQVQGRELFLVLGSSLQDRDDALSSLSTLLAIGGPIALLLAALAGYGATAAALRPVDAMRARAAAISAEEPDERLPIPAARDEISRLGETLNRMLERLEAARDRERRFVDDASHELRTPLALHKTELELALRYGSGEEELRTAIASSIGDLDRLIQLAEDLLVVARSEKGRLALKVERVAVAELLATVRERFDARAAELGRSLVVAGGRPLEIEGDRLRLEQALTSMVDNALRHGGGEIRLWGAEQDGVVALHVNDAGPGFPNAFLPHAFERFTAADGARAGGGSGLGLAIVETIATAHGGAARAANRDGGADVWIELPARPV